MGSKISQLQIPLVIIEITFFFFSVYWREKIAKEDTCLLISSFLRLLLFCIDFFLVFWFLSLSSDCFCCHHCRWPDIITVLIISFVAHSFSLFYLIKYIQNDDRSHRMQAPDWHPYWAKSLTKYWQARRWQKKASIEFIIIF